jgi:hypothetical protein
VVARICKNQRPNLLVVGGFQLSPEGIPLSAVKEAVLTERRGMPEVQGPKRSNHWIHIPTILVVGSFCLYWWYWHKPVPSKAVLWLAGVAAIMALWEMRPIHKAAYLLLVVWLMFIENRAIDKDRADFARDEAHRRQEERQQFSDIGTQLTTNVQKLIDDSDLKFKKTFGQQSTNFDATVKRFIGVNNEQLALSQAQREMIESENGHLIPGSEPMPPMEALGCKEKLDKDAYIITTGRYVTLVTRFPFIPMVVDAEIKNPQGTQPLPGFVYIQPHNLVRVDKSADGLLILSLDFRATDGSIIVKVDQDGFVVNPLFLKRHPDKSTLVVWDSFGKEVLKVRYVNKRLLRIEPHLGEDTELFFDTTKPPMCMPQLPDGGLEIMPALRT